MTHTGPKVKEGADGPVVVQADRGGTDTVPSLLAGLRAVHPALVLIFGPRGDELAALAHGLTPHLPPGCVLAGCSSAGEIGPEGYALGKVVALGFPSRHFRVEAIVLDRLSAIPVAEWMAGLRRMHRDFDADPARSIFGLLLADGLAGQEDVLVSALDAALPAVPVIGGSAGDGLDFRDTWLLEGGRVHRDAAIFLLVETDLAIRQITLAHFRPTDTRAVITAARPDRRGILELNAEPAAREYARLTGIDIQPLGPADFARHPLLLRMGGQHHVRAISAATEDGGLALMAAIEPGMVLTLGHAEDPTRGMAEALEALPRPPLMVLAFDCILRRLALERDGQDGSMSQLYARHRVAGFNTYGEQHSGMHVNQTFVGMAFLPPADAA